MGEIKMSIMESLAVALHYRNIQLFYEDISNIALYSLIILYPVLVYLRYKKIINFLTIKFIIMTLMLVMMISSSLCRGWSWAYLFFIFIMYLAIEGCEAEVQKVEQNRQNNSQGLDGEHKEKKKLSRTTKVSYGIFIIAAVIKVILSYLNY